MALEIRLIADVDLPTEPLLHVGLVWIGTADDGRGIYDSNGQLDVGELAASGPLRKQRCPWVHRRRITVEHRWAGER